MGDRIEFRITGDWKKMASALDSKRFRQNLDDKMAAATKLNGMMMAGEVRKRIKQKRYAANAPLTSLIKKSSTPLIDDADLWGAVTSQALDKYTVFIGILRTAAGTDGKPLTNLAELLHNGGTIPVTEAMRGMFILLAEVGQGKREASELEGRTAEIAQALGNRIRQIKPLKPSTKFIVIPPRPFLASVLKDPVMLKKCEANWRKAAEAAFKDQASGSTSSSAGGPASIPRGSLPSKRTPTAPKPRKVRDRSAAARKGHATRRAKKASGGK